MDKRAQSGLDYLIGMAKKEAHIAKKEAYENALEWAESDQVSKADIIWWLQEKIKGHEKAIKEKDDEGIR